MYVKSKCVLIASVAALGVVSFDANAAPSVGSSGNVNFFNTSDDSQHSSVCFNFSAAPGTTVGCSGSTATPLANGTLNYLTTATADYGILKAGGESSISGGTGSDSTYYSSSIGSAFFRDTWNIAGGTGTGTLNLQCFIRNL
jgi:hypothetical protein